jgi:hypothetical protein
MESTLFQRLKRLRALAALILPLTIVAAGGVRPAMALRPHDAPVGQLRSLSDHYRKVTWEYQRAAQVKRTPTSYSYRRSSNPAYLKWTVAAWTKRAVHAQKLALASIHRRLAVKVPRAAGSAPRLRTIAYNRKLALRLRRIYPGRVTRAFASARRPTRKATLRLWQERSATAAIAVAEHAVRRAQIDSGLLQALMCIHRFEGAWDSNTGNGYYGGLQMDAGFMSNYGPGFFARWGTADHWPVWAQLEAGARAHASGRGFWPWPNTARACGLL